MIELKLLKDFPAEIIALDDVGRSPLAGPVVAGALPIHVPDLETLLMIIRSLTRNGVKDSELLAHDHRKELLEKFKILAVEFREKGFFTLKRVHFTFVT